MLKIFDVCYVKNEEMSFVDKMSYLGIRTFIEGISKILKTIFIKYNFKCKFFMIL